MSFYHAFEGIINSLRSERNLRIHISFANLIVIFALFYKLKGTEWAILVLTIVTVFSAELFNTAIERAVDTATSDVSHTAKLSKDASAGAVLVCAMGAVLVGLCLFNDWGRIVETLHFVFTTPRVLIPCVIVGISDVLYIIFGGKNVK